MQQNYSDILHFWFKEIEPTSWWEKDPSFDAMIQQRFCDIHRKATRCELYHWREHPEGALAEIIILDQFSRNIFRGQALAFAWDALALALAQSAISRGFDKNIEAARRVFFYMPFMHSESREIHEIATNLFQQEEMESNYHYEIAHKNIVDRFGRYPHRNKILGRESTAEEIEFLKTTGSSF